jgi:hypothetical protein
MRRAHGLVFGLSLLVAACGGSQKPAEDADAESSASTAESEADASPSGDGAPGDAGDEKADAKQEDAEEKTAEPASDTSGPAVKRTPKDLLTAPDVIFMFSFNASKVKEGAEERCEKKAKDDPKKKADCMTKEKAKIEVDGMRFEQEKGKWYWMIVRRKGKTLVNLHKIPVEFTDETATSVTLKPVGKDEGTKRGKGPGETKVEVPNEYQISIDDPTLGNMVYEAKIGLEGEQQR